MQQTNTGSEFERSSFRHERDMAKVRSGLPVKVVAVYTASGGSKTQGAIEAAGFVDVQPLISQTDGAGTKQDHGVIYHLPYTRWAGGNAAIIMDPVVGDVGYIKVMDRDISSFKDGVAGGSNTSTYTPNSRRRHDFADSIYVSTLLTAKPGQYLSFQNNAIIIKDANGNTVTLNQQGITITDDNSNTITMANGQITITATTVQINGNLQVTGNVTAGSGGGSSVGLQTHSHSGVTTGAGDTGSPVGGT